ncbi:MAG: NIPSNAP family protein [Variovorax sp.]
MIHELRQYTCTPGSLPAVINRFEVATVALFTKHGIRPIGFWTTLIGESHQQLHYLLEWESLADRERKWGAFMGDAEWQRVVAETEKNGALVSAIRNQMLKPTGFSPLQ